MAAPAAGVVVVSPAMCDAALEAGYFSGYAALPFLGSQRLASNNLQRLAALQSPHVLSWHSMVRRRTPRAAALMRPGQCKPRPWLDQGEKEAHARACARLKMLHYYHGTGHTGKRLMLYRIRALLPQAH